jgi:hypothetical protein
LRSKIGFVAGFVTILVGIAYVPFNYLVILHYYDYLDCPTPPYVAGSTDKISFWGCPPVWFDAFLTIILPALIITLGIMIAIYYSSKQPREVLLKKFALWSLFGVGVAWLLASISLFAFFVPPMLCIGFNCGKNYSSPLGQFAYFGLVVAVFLMLIAALLLHKQKETDSKIPKLESNVK